MGSHQQLLGWGEMWGTKREVKKKERGNQLGKEKKKIHAGLNKLRSSAGEF